MNPVTSETEATQIIRKLRHAGHQAYFAGGCVRDRLIQRPPKDIDIATSATPDQVQELFEKASDLQGKAFGVIRIRQGENVYEVATFRKDGAYLDGRRPESVTFSTAEEDAQRRDFTINGLFFAPLENRVIDYVNGQADLKKRLLRAIGKPEARFEEDHLRIFRAIRFAVELEFEIDPATWAALCTLAPKTISLAPERVRDELTRSFISPQPQRALDLLDESGLLKLWLPEVSAQKGVAQPPQFHPEGDVYVHVRMMMGKLQKPTPALAWSVLLHDIGKPSTYKVDSNGRIRFNEHDVIGARMARELLQRLRFSNAEIDTIADAIAGHMTWKDVPNMRLSTFKRLLARPNFETELTLHHIDCSCSHQDLSIYQAVLERRASIAAEPLKPHPLINGSDLLALGLPSGPGIGKILRIIEDEQLEGLLTERESALHRARELVQSLS